jgi:histidinol phosphatase-like PHP family hydrolase
MTFDDYHAHTNLSYCCDGSITPQDYVEAIRRSDSLRSVAITNHGFAIYFPEDAAWRWEFMTDPSSFDAQVTWGNERLLRHIDEVDTHRAQGLLSGAEVEMMVDGRLTIDPQFVDRLDVLVGSVHWLPVSWRTGSDPGEILDVWLDHSLRLIRSGIDVLGHPLRWISDQIDRLPAEIIPNIVETANASGVAIEINAHYIVNTDVPLLREAARTGTPVTFCTDAHRRDEIGQFDYHARLLEHAGLTLEDLRLWRPCRRRD